VEPGGANAKEGAPANGGADRTRRRAITAAAVLAVVVVVAIVASLRLDPEAVVSASGPLSRLAFVLLVIIEVVLAPIPGGVIAFLASAAWGFWQSWPLHYVGNVIGGLLVFWLARSLGRPFVDRHVPARRRELIERRLFGRPWLMWVVYAVPIFPIDTVSIALGVSGLDRRRFALILVTALPFYTGITAALGAYFGQFIPYLEWFGAAVLVIFVLALVYAVFTLRKHEAV
jgi:uncharacterized membrane protein YdjX (TVP38/TMEM64 family)